MQDNSNLPYAQWVPISGKLGLWQKVPGSVKGDVVCMQELITKRLAPETHRNHCNFCKSGYKDITIEMPHGTLIQAGHVLLYTYITIYYYISLYMTIY